MNNPALRFLAEYVFGLPERLPPLPKNLLDEMTELQIEKAKAGDTDAYMAIMRLVDLYDPMIEGAYDSNQDD
jgi:hypothetical protein